MIFLVTKDTNHQGYEVIRAFSEQANAEALRAELIAYDKGEPLPPNFKSFMDQTPEYKAKYMAWSNGHPVGGKADGYSVIPLPLE